MTDMNMTNNEGELKKCESLRNHNINNNNNNSRMRHEELQNNSMIKTANDLDHTELRKLTMMMMVMTTEMSRRGCVRKKGTASLL